MRPYKIVVIGAPELCGSDNERTNLCSVTLKGYSLTTPRLGRAMNLDHIGLNYLSVSLLSRSRPYRS